LEHDLYLDRAVRQLGAQWADVPDGQLAHVPPLRWEPIDLTGHYVWIEINPVARSGTMRCPFVSGLRGLAYDFDNHDP
jgi:hypothetical protein